MHDQVHMDHLASLKYTHAYAWITYYYIIIIDIKTTNVHPFAN